MNMAERKIRILVAKPGLDGHDRGAKVIASAFRDAGFEVIYTGLHQTPEMIVAAALQEDVDVVGVSILSGAHMVLFRACSSCCASEAGARARHWRWHHPRQDIARLQALGVAHLFGPGTPTTAPIDYVREYFSQGVGEPARS
jgi:methylmalonyl-CoA mutase C-terminal domain/subunit